MTVNQLDRRNGATQQGPCGVRVRVVEETDSYSRSVAGATIEAIRVGKGVAPTRVVAAEGKALTLTRSSIGFPMRSWASIGDDRITVAYIHRASPGSRWCGIPLGRGNLIVYGPGVEHAASNEYGLAFSFVSTSLEELVEFGDRIRASFEAPAHGEVRVVQRSDRTDELGASFEAYLDATMNGVSAERADPEMLRQVVSVLSSPGFERPIAAFRGIDSRDIVHVCVDLADELDQIPTIAELCLAAHVSERRLRDAFSEEFGEPPSRYFRNWALDRARHRLRDADPGTQTVTEIATALGFDHLGRFAGHYREVYGESPSVTLHAPGGHFL